MSIGKKAINAIKKRALPTRLSVSRWWAGGKMDNRNYYMLSLLIALYVISGSLVNAHSCLANPNPVHTDWFIPGEPLTPIDEGRKPLSVREKKDFPTDPTSDTPWENDTSGVSDIQAAFNNARNIENSQLGMSIPMLTLPSQSEWDTMTDGEKALWLINRERIDRGIHPLHGLEENVTSVAQYYAQYLIDNNTWGHYEDGNTPWERLEANPAIGACYDFLSVAENLAVFWTSGSSIPLPIERSVFNWIYDDGTCCSWGHRHAILWYPYNDNGGTSGMEGFLGIGRASGPHSGWNYAELIVMNVFDPCSTWDYGFQAGLAEIILGLKILSGISVSQTMATQADANKDGKVDLADVIHSLQYVSGVRQ